MSSADLLRLAVIMVSAALALVAAIVALLKARSAAANRHTDIQMFRSPASSWTFTSFFAVAVMFITAIVWLF